MSHDHTSPPFPRNILIVAGGIIVLSILIAGFGRMTGAADSTPTAAVVASRQLLFSDRADGAVVVFDAANASAPIDVLAPATNGFIRATMRGLAQQRKREDASRLTPFRLTEWADGRLTLEDPLTGRRVEMEAFGITNEQAFANLLTAKSPS